MLSSSANTKPTPAQKVVIIGGGIVGAMEAYFAHLDAVKNGREVHVVVYDKNSPLLEASKNSTNTALNIFPVLTPDEMLSIVPRGRELTEKLAILFSQPEGIRVDDVPGVNDSPSALLFKQAVELYGSDLNHEDRTQNLLMLGKMSMGLWQQIYRKADEELQEIMRSSNFNPCHEPMSSTPVLHDGYRIDLIYEVANAKTRAQAMQRTYQALGYNQCRLLSPDEVAALDPSLADFCNTHSTQHTWNSDSAAIWRPGGCINAGVFLPKFFAYLQKIQDRFNLMFNKRVTSVMFDDTSNILGLRFEDGSLQLEDAAHTQYVFCPGEAVGTLNNLGFDEPAYVGFAGPSLCLTIPVSAQQALQYKHFNHCMEVHKVGVVLAWQARFHDNKLIIGVAGTKAFYGDLQPTIDQDFAKNRHLLQLNMINDVLPQMVSIACGYDTSGMTLQFDDLQTLENRGILKRWVGRRAVAYDGFPTLGKLYCNGIEVPNARCTTHLGSGGVSFSPAAVVMSRSSRQGVNDPFTAQILEYADSSRRP